MTKFNAGDKVRLNKHFGGYEGIDNAPEPGTEVVIIRTLDDEWKYDFEWENEDWLLFDHEAELVTAVPADVAPIPAGNVVDVDGTPMDLAALRNPELFMQALANRDAVILVLEKERDALRAALKDIQAGLVGNQNHCPDCAAVALIASLALEHGVTVKI